MRRPSPGGGTSEGREPLGRVGVLYEIPAGKRLALSPNVSFDFVEGTAVVVYGVTISPSSSDLLQLLVRQGGDSETNGRDREPKR